MCAPAVASTRPRTAEGRGGGGSGRPRPWRAGSWSGGRRGGGSGVGGRLLLRKPLLAQPGLAHHPDAGGDDAPVLMGYEVSNVSAFWEVRLECLARARVVRFMYSSDYYHYTS